MEPDSGGGTARASWGLTPARTGQLLLAVGVVAVMMIAVTAADAVSDRIPDTGYLTRDPTSVGRVPWYAGSVSRLTNLAWACAATLSVVAGLVATGSLRRRLLLLGAVLAALTVDDTLLLHDAVLPGRGIPERLVVGAYVVAGLALAWLWWPSRRTAAGLAFYLGAALLGVSVAIDLFIARAYVSEDGAKLLGLLCWGLAAWWLFTDELASLRAGADGSDRAVSKP